MAREVLEPYRKMARCTSAFVATFLVVGCGAPNGNVPNVAAQAAVLPVEKAAGAPPPAVYASAPAHVSCPEGMAEIPASSPKERAYCIDRWEASLVEVAPDGTEKPLTPFGPLEGGRNVRAVSQPHVYPQGYVSEVQAQQACAASGKRLCKAPEWKKACRGPEKKTWGYADRREPGRCNDRGKNPLVTMFGRRGWSSRTMNLAKLNQMSGTLSKTGDHESCTNGYGVYDMVGNLHEWVADPAGTFQGGFYLDVTKNGDGCGYKTTAHEARYHDYSTGFRCCADPK